MDEHEIEDLIFQKCVSLIMGRPHSIHEMMLYIPKKLKHFEGTIRNIDEASARIIERLIEREYLDDLKFIEWWVDNRTYFRPRGVRGLMSELMQKGVDKNLLEEFKGVGL